MHGRGVCVAGGACMAGGACVAGGAYGGGACMVGCVGGGGHALQGHVWRGGMHGRGACMAGETAIVAGGTHPTGMHSCAKFRLSLIYIAGGRLGFRSHSCSWLLGLESESNSVKCENFCIVKCSHWVCSLNSSRNPAV